MANARWDFPKLGGGQKQGYTNSGIETFKGTELLDNLAREICQNSLDAKDPSKNEPVIVEFKLTTIQKEGYPFLQEYSEYLKRGKIFWQDQSDKKVMQFLNRAEKIIEENEIKILSASDYNTTGLTGSDCGIMNTSAWSALVNSDGVSDKSEGSGGSYGIGKNAPFACSDLSVVFYNTYAKDEKKVFEGVARAATLLDSNNKPTQAIGHYRSDDTSNDNYKPITNDIVCPIRDLFMREKYGTDIIVVGCNSFIEKNRDWQDKLVQAVLHHFLIAIKEDKLVVKIEDILINSSTLPILINNYKKENASSAVTLHFYETLLEPDGGIQYKTILEDKDLEIYIKSSPEYKRKIGKFRLSGMLVGEQWKRTYQNFTTVVIVRGNKLNELLRKTEPPKHNYWDSNRIENRDEAEKAKDCIEKIEIAIKEAISEIYREDQMDSVDAGVGDFLPDDINDSLGQTHGTDKLRPIQKLLGEPKVQKIHLNKNVSSAGKDEGKEVLDENEINNTSRSEYRHSIYRHNPKIDNSKDDEDDSVTEGITPQTGTKTLTTYPNIKNQRIMVTNKDLGLYKIVLCPEQNYKSVFIEFFAIGEGNSIDKLFVDKYSVDKQTTKAQNTKIGPISLDKGTPKEIYVTFANKEKMLINMNLTEEIES